MVIDCVVFVIYLRGDCCDENAHGFVHATMLKEMKVRIDASVMGYVLERRNVWGIVQWMCSKWTFVWGFWVCT